MVDNNKMVKVTNRTFGGVGYSLPELHINRNFRYKETKELPYSEIHALANIDGGQYILENCLLIEDAEVVQDIVGAVEPEYNYTEEDIKKLMETGSLDEFLDCLDFAPDGVKQIIKHVAIELPLNDIAKRDAIKKKLGFDVTAAVTNKELSKPDAEEAETDNGGKRRAAAPTAGTALPTRRSSLPTKSAE